MVTASCTRPKSGRCTPADMGPMLQQRASAVAAATHAATTVIAAAAAVAAAAIACADARAAADATARATAPSDGTPTAEATPIVTATPTTNAAADANATTTAIVGAALRAARWGVGGAGVPQLAHVAVFAVGGRRRHCGSGRATSHIRRVRIGCVSRNGGRIIEPQLPPHTCLWGVGGVLWTPARPIPPGATPIGAITARPTTRWAGCGIRRQCRAALAPTREFSGDLRDEQQPPTN